VVREAEKEGGKARQWGRKLDAMWDCVWGRVWEKQKA